MKKALALILCAVALSLMVACGGNLNQTINSTPSSPSVPSTPSSPSSPDSTLSSTVDSELSDSTTQSSTVSSETVSSTNDSTTQSTIQSTTQSTHQSTTTSSTTASSRPAPVITEDMTPYKVNVVGTGDNRVIKYVNDTFSYPIITPYYNGYKTALTMTFDDGYDTGTGTIVSDMFEKYGYRGTMMIGPCFINGEEYITEWNKIFARGYLNLGCHGYNHKEPTTLPSSEYEHEIKDAIMFLREKFPGQRVLTFATPYAHINDAYESYLSQFVLGNRLESGGSFLNPLNEYNPYRVKALSVNKANPVGGTLYSSIDTCIKYENWIVELFHCVIDGAVNSTDIDKSSFESHCEYLYRHYRDQLWFATFEEVLVYAEEVNHITVDYTACDRESMSFVVTPDGTLDKELYNIPVTLKVFLPRKLADSAYAIVNGEYQPLEIDVDFVTGYNYAMVRDIPYTQESDVKVIFGGNKTMRNNCIHSYEVSEQKEATHDEFGYTKMTCPNCNQSYMTKYVAPVHDFTGKEIVVVEPTEEKTGFTKVFCTQCDEYEVVEVQIKQSTDTVEN